MWLLALWLPLLATTAAAVDHVDPLGLGTSLQVVRDPGSGCTCKVLTHSAPHVICFDLVGCVRFPRNVTVSPRRGEAVLHVLAMRIPALLVGDLSRLHYLTGLTVEDSQGVLRRVEPGVFQGMSLLVNLSVSHHANLTHLEDGALAGLSALRELSLVDNGFLTLGDVTPALAALPSLRVLRLDENALRQVLADDFVLMANSSLEELSLAGCALGKLHADAFAPLQSLATLRLAKNAALDVSDLAASLQAVRALRILDIASIGMAIANAANTTTDAPFLLLQAVARSQVTTLLLDRNAVRRLDPGSIPVMRGLRGLGLSRVGLSEGRPGALASDVLPDLEDLDLSGNRLATLQRGFVSHRLLSLDLNHTFSEVGTHFGLTTGVFDDLRQLRLLHLSYNFLVHVTNQTLVGLESLKVLTMQNSTIFKVDEGAFLSLPQLEFLDLQANPLGRNRPLSAGLFLGLGNLRVLLLGRCELRSLGPDPDVFRHLRSLTRLELQDNALTSLDGGHALHSLQHLQHLDVSRNRVAPWSDALLANNQSLDVLLAAGNKITHLSAAMLEDLRDVRAVDLADNVFHCGCDLYRPLLAVSPTGNVSNLMNRPYKCLSPDRWRDHPVAEYVAWMSEARRGRAECPGPGAEVGMTTLLVALPLALLLLLLTASVAVAFRYRHLIRYCYAVVIRKARPGGGAEAEMAAYANYQYDAFVSYSSEDQAFVHSLVATLEDEEPHFRLCVYERDFEVGTVITEAVLSSVAQSRRVLLVVSPAFARSHWCAWEAHIAHHQRLLAEDALLVVRLGAVDEATLTPTLRYLLSTRIYLEWSEDASADKRQLFWRKLRATLGARPVRGVPG